MAFANNQPQSPLDDDKPDSPKDSGDVVKETSMKPRLHTHEQKDDDALTHLNVADKMTHYKLRAQRFLDQSGIGSFPTANNTMMGPLFELYDDEVAQHMAECYPLVHGGVL